MTAYSRKVKLYIALQFMVVQNEVMLSRELVINSSRALASKDTDGVYICAKEALEILYQFEEYIYERLDEAIKEVELIDEDDDIEFSPDNRIKTIAYTDFLRGHIQEVIENREKINIPDICRYLEKILEREVKEKDLLDTIIVNRSKLITAFRENLYSINVEEYVELIDYLISAIDSEYYSTGGSNLKERNILDVAEKTSITGLSSLWNLTDM